MKKQLKRVEEVSADAPVTNARANINSSFWGCVSLLNKFPHPLLSSLPLFDVGICFGISEPFGELQEETGLSEQKRVNSQNLQLLCFSQQGATGVILVNLHA